MTTIMPQSELMRRAIKWIDEHLKDSREPLKAIVDKAAMNFNLGPKDTEFLLKFFKENREGSKA